MRTRWKVLIGVGVVSGALLLLGALRSEKTAATKASAPAPANWTAFGATDEAWKSAHVADPNPKLVEGCCFLPRLPSGGSRYYSVAYTDTDGVSRVLNYSMRFEPAISVDSALAVVREEAAPHSSLAFSVRKRECLQVEYNSTTAAVPSGSACQCSRSCSPRQPADDSTGVPWRRSSSWRSRAATARSTARDVLCQSRSPLQRGTTRVAGSTTERSSRCAKPGTIY